MTLPIVTRAREYLRGRDLLTARNLTTLLDDAVLLRFDLLPVEVKALCGLLLADGDLEDAATAAEIPVARLIAAAQNLERKGLLTLDGYTADLTLAQQQLRVETSYEAAKDAAGVPSPVVVLQSLPALVAALAKSDKNPTRAGAAVYQFVFGRRVTNFPLIGKAVQAVGVQSFAQLCLEKATYPFEGEPLKELAVFAFARANGFRADDAPDEAAQKREVLASDHASWQKRLQRWESYGGRADAVQTVQKWANQGRITWAQADADIRQIRLDYSRDS